MKLFFFILFSITFIFSAGKLIIIDGVSSSGKTTIIDKLSPILDKNYETIALDDYVTKLFVERFEHKLSQDEFTKKISEQKQKMYDDIHEKIGRGKNIILDTVLIGFNGTEDLKETLEHLRDLQVIQILIYCPLDLLIERIEFRNKKAIDNNNRSDFRPSYLVFRFDEMFKKLERDEVFIGKVFYKDIEHAYQVATKDTLDLEKLNLLKQNLIDHLQIESQSFANISSKIHYDYVLDTSLHDPIEGAKMIYDFILNYTPSAFEKNCKKFLENNKDV